MKTGPLLLCAALFASGCSNSPTAPCTDCQPVKAPSISCPASISVTTPSWTATSATVAYPAPVVSDGTPPVMTACSVASNSSFSAGKTEVSCTATDAINRSAICYFAVTVNVPAPPIPRLQGTRFLAFGDSITLGNNGCNNLSDPCILWIDIGNEYPTYLEQMLARRYTQQNPTVGISAAGGETAYAGAQRIDTELDAYRPNALFLLEGVNDFFGDNNGTPASVADALRYDIQAAKARGIKVFISTLTPIFCNPDYAQYQHCRDWAINDIPNTNTLIRSLAAEQGVVLVDGYAALAPRISTDLDYDGLHLTRAGRMDLAQAFFDAVKANFEEGVTSSRRSIR